MMLRKAGDIRAPSKVILANDFSFSAYFEYRNWGNRVFNYMYWHDKTRLGYGNVLFVDSHVGYHRAVATPDFQRGPDWSFTWDGE
ncbi:MAG: hypothetical protein KIT22_00090 [Verrucomicrobiae bacterium]|nr:hypothetical protein [Verrucomicrobiae bacterium]